VAQTEHSKNITQVNIRIPETLRKKLAKLAIDKDLTISELCAMAMQAYLKGPTQ